MDMIEARATVVKAQGHTVWLRGGPQGACEGCAQKAGCGLAALGHGGARRAVAAHSPLPLKAGDQVLVCVDGRRLLRAAASLYLLPLLALLAAVLAADSVLPAGLPGRSLVLSGCALLGLGLGLAVARRVGGADAIRIAQAPP